MEMINSGQIRIEDFGGLVIDGDFDSLLDPATPEEKEEDRADLADLAQAESAANAERPYFI